jgi:AcrR family transcriptional regulator
MHRRPASIEFVSGYHDIVWVYKDNLMADVAETVIRGPAARTRPAARRQDIVAAAIRVIARDGIRACTISALEHETGFARGHFTYHFETKEEIIKLAFATVASDWASLQMHAMVGGMAAARLENGVRAAIDWAQRRPEYFRCLMNFRVELVRNPDAFPPSGSIRRQLWEFGAQLIRDGIAEGAFRPPDDPLTEIRTVFAIVDGLLLHAALDPGFCRPDALADRAWAVVAHRLGAPRPAPAAGTAEFDSPARSS